MLKPPQSINDALRWLILDLETPGEHDSVKVPHPDTITLLGRLNGLCAQNMIATNWFPHDQMRRTP